MQQTDFSAHNEEARLVWEAYQAGRPIRPPMRIGANSRVWVLDPSLNQSGITWKDFFHDPDLMYRTQLDLNRYLAFNIPHDGEMGLPAGGWKVSVEFQNVVEEAWLGSQVIFPPNQVAATTPAYAGENKQRIFERGMPGPFDGIFSRMREFHELFVEKARADEFYGRPVAVEPPNALGTDGPFTVAIGVRGTEFLEDMLLDEPYYHAVMAFITEAIIQKVRGWRAYMGREMRPQKGGFADDAIQFLSVKTYREKVLPYHRRLLEGLYGSGPFGLHLCGNVQRLLPTLVEELHIGSFDTGYPIRWETLRDEVGEAVEIEGGVRVTDLLSCTPAEITRKSEEILHSGILRGGRFIFQEANNLPPRVPMENLQAMYDAVRRIRY